MIPGVFSVAPAGFGASTLSGLSGAGALAGAGAGGAAATGLSAALGPIGWASLGLQAAGTLGSVFAGQGASDEARKEMLGQRQYSAGSTLHAQEFPRYLDLRDTKREIALANSPGFRRAEGFTERQDTFDKFAGKYGPAFARLSSNAFYG